jgi:hypothetical protein
LLIYQIVKTFTLWHLVHGGEKEQLIQLTADRLNEGTLIHQLLKQGDKQYRNFLLDLFSMGKSINPNN